MEPSDVARVISASLTGLFIDDLVPRIHMMADLTAAKDSLHLNQLMTVAYGFCCFQACISGGHKTDNRTRCIDIYASANCLRSVLRLS